MLEPLHIFRGAPTLPLQRVLAPDVSLDNLADSVEPNPTRRIGVSQTTQHLSDRFVICSELQEVSSARWITLTGLSRFQWRQPRPQLQS